jgi:hypothetical protein
MIFFNDSRYFLEQAIGFDFQPHEAVLPNTDDFSSLIKGDRSVIIFFIKDALEKVRDYIYELERNYDKFEEMVKPIIDNAEDRFFKLGDRPAALELRFIEGAIYYKKNRSEYNDWKCFSSPNFSFPGCPDTVFYDLIICAEVLSLHKRNDVPRYPKRFCIEIADNEKEYSEQIKRAHKALKMFLNGFLKDIPAQDIYDNITDDLYNRCRKYIS